MWCPPRSGNVRRYGSPSLMMYLRFPLSRVSPHSSPCSELDSQLNPSSSNWRRNVVAPASPIVPRNYDRGVGPVRAVADRVDHQGYPGWAAAIVGGGVDSRCQKVFRSGTVEDSFFSTREHVIDGFHPHHHGVVHVANLIAPGAKSATGVNFFFHQGRLKSG
jgi:hypothetical protein